MTSEWQLNKIGLLDFWYYDEQEFTFLDGRMLLRGANGSGKSVTMQSFIPLLLDGNMRPERLDPFGSRARKMENYLLEEDDDREERTGYLYMELKRVESDTYTTIGIGMRARKNKKLDTWYFCVTDGRRIGEDLFLYKDVQNRLTCTKQELKIRIGEGGRVMDSQSEYAATVNRLLFGFETTEEYQELIELLIQLRTPKLSKDFKPTVINEILSHSLQTLSEDDLRPMSEAIENMDNLRTNLAALNDSIQAAQQIEKAYDQYNEIVLFEKALLFVKAARECRALEKKAQELFREKERSERALLEEQENYEKLRQEEEILAKERESLKDSDAAHLKEQELQKEKELLEAKEDEEKKAAQEQDKKERYQDTERVRKEQEASNEQIWEEVKEDLDQMEEEITDLSFDEFSFMKQELIDAPEKEYAFQAHSKLLSEYIRRVESGKEVLTKQKNCQERHDRKLEELDGYHSRQESAEKECRQTEILLEETKAELVEKLYQWEKQNEQMHLPAEILQQMAQQIERYQFGSDYSMIPALGRDLFFEKESMLQNQLREIEFEKNGLAQELEAAEKELKEWQDKKDPEPKRQEAVLKNRQLLREKGIPFLEFYKTVDFEDGLDEKKAANLEEALYHMGILDALIVPAEYREQIRALDSGVCDKYLFGDVAHVRPNLLALLEVDNAENDILKYQSVSNILSCIGLNEGEDFDQTTANVQTDHTTWITPEGNYRIGVLEGTVTGEYSAKYLGVRARERFRMEKIAELETLIEGLRTQVDALNEKERKLQESRQKLKQEWDDFPKDIDLKTAAKEYADSSYNLERLNEQIKALREELAEIKKELDTIGIRVSEVCAKCYLSPRLDLFEKAICSLSVYRELFTDLQVKHERYLNGCRHMVILADQLEQIDDDLDKIRYELLKTRRKISDLEAELASVRGQLALTDYEQIRERLEHCVKRLAELPLEKETSKSAQTHWEDEGKHLTDRLLTQEGEYQKARKRAEYLKKAFCEEYELGYVEKPFAVSDDMEDQAGQICNLFTGKFGNKKQTDLLSNLQDSYHKNRGYLLDFQLTIHTLFEQQQEEDDRLEVSLRRIDIRAKYRGVNVRFKELLLKLREDAEEQKRILSDRDRELFEDILANTVSKKIRAKILASNRWVANMNRLMDSMHTSSGLKLSLNWRKKHAGKEDQLDTKELVELLSKDVEIMREEEVNKLSMHFRSKIEEARKLSDDNNVQSFHAIMREVLDYRKWFEFTLECQKMGEKKKELTDRVFFTFSGGEKAMSMYVPLFSAVVAKYAGARKDAPRLLSLDEAFAGVDETNIRDMFRLMNECKFNFMINSQVLWGDYDTVPGLAIYQLLRPENAKFVTVISYIWNGTQRVLVEP